MRLKTQQRANPASQPSRFQEAGSSSLRKPNRSFTSAPPQRYLPVLLSARTAASSEASQGSLVAWRARGGFPLQKRAADAR